MPSTASTMVLSVLCIHRPTTTTAPPWLASAFLPPRMGAAPPVPARTGGAASLLGADGRRFRARGTADNDAESATADDAATDAKATKKDNKAMAFLRKVGRVGGAANKDFVNAMGADEGSVGKVPAARGNAAMGVKKAKSAYQECTASGVVDDMSEPFPITSSGTEWRGVSDRVMGGNSNGYIQREADINGKAANVLTGQVSLDNNGGFIQMVTDLALDPSKGVSVDASNYDGIELDVLSRSMVRSEEEGLRGNCLEFNVHLRAPGTLQQSSYRATHELSERNVWETVRLPFTSFAGHGPDSNDESLDPSALRRIGIVAIGKEMDVFLAVAGVRFYSVF